MLFCGFELEFLLIFEKEFNCLTPHIVPVNIDDGHSLSVLKEWDRFRQYVEEAVTYTFDCMLNEKKTSAVGIFLGLITRMVTHMGQQTICPAGVQTFSLSHDRSLTPCFMYTSNNDISYGRIGDDPKKILSNAYAFDKKINNKDLSDNCLNCTARAVCSSCLGSFNIENGSAVVSNSIFCETIQHAMLVILEKVGELKADAEKWDNLCSYMRDAFYGQKKEKK